MKKFIFYLLLLLICFHGAGCISMQVIDKAHGTPPKRDDAEPGYYALLPVTLPLDVVLGGLFFWLWAESENDDDDFSYSPSSSRGGDGLKVKRP